MPASFQTPRHFSLVTSALVGERQEPSTPSSLPLYPHPENWLEARPKLLRVMRSLSSDEEAKPWLGIFDGRKRRALRLDLLDPKAIYHIFFAPSDPVILVLRGRGLLLGENSGSLGTGKIDDNKGRVK